MHVGKLSLAGALAMLVAGCGSGINVRSDWNPETNFANYQTFAVLDAANGGGSLSQLDHQRIMRAIGSTLVSKGFRQVENPGNADMSVGWQLTTDQRSSYQTVSTGWGGYGRYGGYYGGWGGGMSSSTTREIRYDVGTLVIGIFDEAKDELVFTATGSKTLESRNLPPDEVEARIQEAVQTILRDFPPGS